ncbi:hypothetical protein LCGC14_2539190, partial [marine sediment metagenome]
PKKHSITYYSLPVLRRWVLRLAKYGHWGDVAMTDNSVQYCPWCGVKLEDAE